MKTINESLNHLDMEHELLPLLGIDEFRSRLGEDADIITLNFIIKSKEAGNDLVTWLERGYDFVLDAEVSPGEVERGKFYVFAEMNRRPSAPRKIMELLDDLSTLTGVDSENWSLKIKRQRYPATKENIEQHIATTANEYKKENESELNEWRQTAGLKTISTYNNDDDIKAIKRIAGIYK